jgi:hypothetical protein
MNAACPPPELLADMPLWRLLVLFDDVEREFGASTPTGRLIARLVKERLRGERSASHGKQTIGACHAG